MLLHLRPDPVHAEFIEGGGIVHRGVKAMDHLDGGRLGQARHGLAEILGGGDAPLVCGHEPGLPVETLGIHQGAVHIKDRALFHSQIPSFLYAVGCGGSPPWNWRL